jgi:hypothetical protein
VSALRLTPETASFTLLDPAMAVDGEAEIIDGTRLEGSEIPVQPVINAAVKTTDKTKGTLYMTLLPLIETAKRAAWRETMESKVAVELAGCSHHNDSTPGPARNRLVRRTERGQCPGHCSVG